MRKKLNKKRRPDKRKLKFYRRLKMIKKPKNRLKKQAHPRHKLK